MRRQKVKYTRALLPLEGESLLSLSLGSYQARQEHTQEAYNPVQLVNYRTRFCERPK